jgi:hypothetical protein
MGLERAAVFIANSIKQRQLFLTSPHIPYLDGAAGKLHVAISRPLMRG